MNDTKTEKPKKRGKNGGKRPGSGRKKGGMNKKTVEQKIVEEELKQRVLRGAQGLMDAQFSLAKGCSFLYVIKTTKKGSSRPRLIADRHIIEKYLAGDLENTKDTYYYITTEKPSSQSIDSLLDRTFGKAASKTELTGSDGGDIIIKHSIPDTQLDTKEDE